MIKNRTLMVVMTDPPPEREEEWNKWYNTQHIPNRVNNIPGFVSARRFVAIEGQPKYLALYDLESIDVLASDSYLKLREKESALGPGSFESIARTLPNFSRGVYDQIYPEQGEYKIPETKFILAVGHDVPPNREEEFNAWYNTEHIPAMKRVPGYITFRRFKVSEEESSSAGKSSETLKEAIKRINTPEYLAVYDLANEKVLQSEAFLRERESPWCNWVRSWYTRRFRFLGRLIYSSL